MHVHLYHINNTINLLLSYLLKSYTYMSKSLVILAKDETLMCSFTLKVHTQM